LEASFLPSIFAALKTHDLYSMNRLFFFLCLCLPLSLTAQEKDFYRHEFQLWLGANSHQAFELEPVYSLMYNKVFGFTLGLNMMAQSVNKVGYYNEDKYQWRITDGQNKAIAFLLRPALRFRIPVLKEEGRSFMHLNLEPGAFISLIPNSRLTFDYVDIRDPTSMFLPHKSQTVSNSGGESLFFHAKGYLSVDMGGWAISAGFAYSNFDIYSSRRNIVIDGHSVNEMIWSKRTTRSLFISLGYLL
jgi:hypothetical protein